MSGFAGFGTATGSSNKEGATPSFGFAAPGPAPSFGSAATTAAAPGLSFGAAAPASSGAAAAPSFGAPAAGTSTPVAPSSGLGAAAPSAPAPSFGAPSTAAGTTPASSFGTATSGTGSAGTATSATPSTTAFTAAPAAGFGSAASGSGAGSTSSASGDTTRWMDPLPLDSILNKLKAQMKTDIVNFRRESKRVKKWEDKLRCNIRLISIANADVQELAKNQETLDRDITNIESDRKDLEDGLAELEDRVKRQMDKMAPRYGDDENDEERRRIYRMAEELAVHLESMDHTVAKLAGEFNQARGYTEDGDDTPEDGNIFSSINQILNNHHDCLAELEFECQEMGTEIKKLRDSVRGTRHQTNTSTSMQY